MIRIFCAATLIVGALCLSDAPRGEAANRAIVKVNFTYPTSPGMFANGSGATGTYSGINDPEIVVKVYDSCNNLVGSYATLATPSAPGAGNGTWESTAITQDTEATYSFVVNITGTTATKTASPVIIP